MGGDALMVNAFQLFLVVALVGVAMYAQYWYDRAHRLMDAMSYMIEDGIDESRNDTEPGDHDE